MIDDVSEVRAIATRIAPLLAGAGPDIQGAVLADLMTTWLLGFQGQNIEALRAELLDAHVKAIRAMLEEWSSQ